MTTTPDTLSTVELDDRVSAHPQGWQREVTVNVTVGAVTHRDYTLRATVYRDSYDFQSRLYVDVWAPATLEWHTVQTLSGQEHGDLPSSSLLRCHTRTSAVEPDAQAAIRYATQPVVDDLIAYAITVLL